ncbi:4645_t:CDS:2 [Dentiscutata erythropus]|uniref:4645_t:CDS:1 n=1 Tax=Dentiscutata erythropus TaxID=1348616 RepID=A0A9N9NKC8_9GLOM|nr:4645_t:CDS:2 [Dentiscutata erythropus]
MSKPRPRSFTAIPSEEYSNEGSTIASAKGLLIEQQVSKDILAGKTIGVWDEFNYI